MTSSSGGSTIVTNEHFAIQKFTSSSVSSRIVSLISRLRKVRVRLYFRKGYGPDKIVFLDRYLEYDPFWYIPSINSYEESSGTITWSRITPLNSDPDRLLSQCFLLKNYIKICYDVSKALYALKLTGIMHNDTRLDNIGIHGQNFVLFDFDGSGTPLEKCKDYIDDYNDLLESFRFYNITLPEQMRRFTGVNSLVEVVKELGLTQSLDNSVNFLENLTIIL